MSCSKRRLTKQPYCEEDPNCYWDKRCKTRKNKPNGNSLAMSNTKKLDVILERLGNIEKALETMNKTRKNTNNVNMNNNAGLPSPIDEIDAEEDEENFNNTMNRNNNGNNNRNNNGNNNRNNNGNNNRNNNGNNNRNTIKNNNGNNNNNNTRKTANVPPGVLLNRAEKNNTNSVKNGNNTASVSPNALLRRMNNNENKEKNRNNMSISPLSNNNK